MNQSTEKQIFITWLKGLYTCITSQIISLTPPPRIPTTTDLLADTIIVLWFAIYKNDINTMEFGFWNMSLPITVNIFNGSNDLFSSVLLMYLDQRSGASFSAHDPESFMRIDSRLTRHPSVIVDVQNA